MLDPLTAIGLVGNIIQFIDFGCKIVSKATETYKSADGVLKENTDVEVVTNDLISINAVLTTSSATTSADPALQELCEGCIEVASDLLAALTQLKAGKDPTRWKSVRKALRSVWSKEKISSLEARLALFRDEVNLRIVVSLRTQIEALSQQQSDRFDEIDGDQKALVNSIRSGQDVFAASLQIQTQSLKDAIAESETRVKDDQVAARDQVIAVVEDTAQINQLEHEATREEIAQIKVALQELSEQMERKNEELKDALEKFTAATTIKKKQKFQDLSRAISLALLALETIYRSLKTLQANIQSRSVVFLSQSTVRQLWGFRADASHNSKASASFGGGYNLSGIPTTVVENAIMRYYAQYYFPRFFRGITYSAFTQQGLVHPRTHTKWRAPVQTDVSLSLKKDAGAMKQRETQALELLDLVFSGSSTHLRSSKAYAFVWLVAIINSLPDEFFGPSGDRNSFFEAVFLEGKGYPDDESTARRVSAHGYESCLTRLKQDVQVWQTIADLCGISEAFHGTINLAKSGSPLDQADNQITRLSKLESEELLLFLFWLFSVDFQQITPRYSPHLPHKVQYVFRQFVSKDYPLDRGLLVTYNTTFQVARFFQTAGVMMQIHSVIEGDRSYIIPHPWDKRNLIQNECEPFYDKQPDEDSFPGRITFG